LLLSQELSVLLVHASHGAQVVGQGFDQDLGRLVVVAGKSFLELLNIHGHRLLEKLNILRLTNGDEHVLEGLEGELADTFAVLIRHVLRNYREERFNEGTESFSHVLTDLLQDSEGASFAHKGIGIHRNFLLSKALDLDLHLHIIRGGWHID
jgi:hypothetical protein